MTDCKDCAALRAALEDIVDRDRQPLDPYWPRLKSAGMRQVAEEALRATPHCKDAGKCECPNDGSPHLGDCHAALQARLDGQIQLNAEIAQALKTAIGSEHATQERLTKAEGLLRECGADGLSDHLQLELAAFLASKPEGAR